MQKIAIFCLVLAPGFISCGNSSTDTTQNKETCIPPPIASSYYPTAVFNSKDVQGSIIIGWSTCGLGIHTDKSKAFLAVAINKLVIKVKNREILVKEFYPATNVNEIQATLSYNDLNDYSIDVFNSLLDGGGNLIIYTNGSVENPSIMICGQKECGK